ncbi:hypothetical protein EYF80_027281 [Liparis tanakae]|uniref:Uncharacterized protein n=1 Tax=Liparis tanakae TaxID=230148 RepID=A0A4Z2H9C5_9TELE|nr:hypothetical protein EYF80_027281 [Liparis tanakae]
MKAQLEPMTFSRAAVGSWTGERCGSRILSGSSLSPPHLEERLGSRAPTGLAAAPALTKRAEARRRRSNSLTSEAIAVHGRIFQNRLRLAMKERAEAAHRIDSVPPVERPILTSPRLAPLSVFSHEHKGKNAFLQYRNK